MLKPLQLLTLRAVCRSGSFAIAARDLGYTSSAVSQQIAALEKDTGLVLFERDAHGVRATTAAARLVELSKPVLTALEDLDHQVRQLATGTIGRIKLGSFPTASVRVVPPALATFAGAFPGAEITLEEGEPGELTGPLLEGELDVALVYEYGLCPERWPDGLVAHRFLHEDLLLLSARDGRRAPELSRLAARRWIASAHDSPGSLSLTRLCAAAGFTPDIAFRSNNYDVVRELVAQNQGVAIVPALGHLPDERVLATRLNQRSAHRAVVMLHRRANSNPLLAGLVSILSDTLPPGLQHVRHVGT